MSDQEPLQKRKLRTGANIWWDREQLANRRVESKSRRDVQSEAGGSHAENTYPLMMDLGKDIKSAFSVHVRVTARTEGKERSRRLQRV